MRASLTQFLSRISDLRYYLDILDLEAELVALPLEDTNRNDLDRILPKLKEHYSATPGKRRFDYTTAIVSLYGFWEQYIEDLLRSYVSALAGWVVSYADLPSEVARTHLDGSVAVLARIRESRSGADLSEADVVTCLHQCLSGTSKYRLNLEAFILHRANLRRAIVEQLASGVGVTNLAQRVKGTKAIMSFMSTQYPGRSPNSVTTEELFAPLDDLAERRNEASHGVPTDILSNDLLRDLIVAIESLASGVFEVFLRASFPFEASGGLSLGKPVEVFRGKIVGVRLQEGEIAVGDRILIKLGGSRDSFKEARVVGLEVNGTPYPLVQADKPIDVGAKLTSNVKPSQELYLIPSRNRSISRSGGDAGVQEGLTI